MAITQYGSFNTFTPEFHELRSKKEIIWMNSLTYRPRLIKRSMIQISSKT